MKVPFLDLKVQYQKIEHEINAAIFDVLSKTAFASGPFVEEFEAKFAEFCGAKYCIAVNSGTSALHSALLAHSIKPGDEIITVPNTFISTVWAITYCGAVPVFVDVDPRTWLINSALIEKAITPKTKAILPVHLYGQPADLSAIEEIAKEHNLLIIEDAAQAHAAQYKKRPIGASGNTACFSFYPGKNLGAFGEGGAVLTDSKKITDYIRMLRNHAQPERYIHNFIGYNFRMDGIQGAVLSTKLKYLKNWTSYRNKIATIYNEELSSIGDIQLPHITKDAYSSFHLYVIHTNNRDKLMNFLLDHNIQTGLHYPIPIHLQNAYKDLGYEKGDFPVAEKNASTCLSLPIYPELELKKVKKVIDSIKKYFT